MDSENNDKNQQKVWKLTKNKKRQPTWNKCRLPLASKTEYHTGFQLKYD